MSDLTGELQRMADEAARAARPVAADEVIRQGDRKRRRLVTWQALGGLSVAGIVAAVVLAMTALAPASRPAGQPTARLAAWTVVKQADGTVSVFIREFRDAAGLQRKLRADGVPASVIFYPSRLPRGVPFSHLFRVPGNPCGEFPRQGKLLTVVRGGHPFQGHSALAIIHPSDLPRGAGVQFIATRNVGHPATPDQRHALGVWLVRASTQCTGS